MTEDLSKAENKICRVCGDRALGYNFNAITCESCKAFFRRNALKTKEFTCPFNNNCSVDTITRRFCQKCRLNKCFTIGMKKEWILTDEEKKVKRAKIEENRQRKRPSGRKRGEHSLIPSPIGSSVSSPAAVNDSPDTVTTQKSKRSSNSDGECSLPTKMSRTTIIHEDSSDIPILMSDSVSTCYSDHEAPSSNELVVPNSNYIKKEPKSPSSTGAGLIGDLIQASSPVSSLHAYTSLPTPSPQTPDNNANFSNSRPSSPSALSPEGGCGMSSKHTSISKDVFDKAVEIEMTHISMRPIDSDAPFLYPDEKKRIEELIVANEVLKIPVVCEVTDPSLLDVINMTDHAIRRLIKMSKKINAFKCMCQEDQIALLKGGCIELMILRSAMIYDQEQNCWQGLQGPTCKSIRVDVLKEAPGNLYEEHKRFIMSFDPLWRSNETIMLLLCAITLFTPVRLNIIHKDTIKYNQCIYYYLLSRYLKTIYPSCEAKTYYLRLIQKLHELQDLTENHIRILLDVNPNDVEPLLIEIFDLKHLKQ